MRTFLLIALLISTAACADDGDQGGVSSTLANIGAGSQSTGSTAAR